jgi:hypothetical protein
LDKIPDELTRSFSCNLLAVMQLRHHSQLWQDGGYLWPPTFNKIAGPGLDSLEDESATLTSITLSRVDPPTACHLTVELNGTSYIGMIKVGDPAFCHRICSFLRSHIGKTLKAIGDLELP